MSLVLEVSQLKKSYHDKPVLNGITFNLEAGKFYTLLGQNGAGKSTLLKLISRSEFPDSGEAYLLKEDLYTDRETINRNMGFVSESNDYSVPIEIGKFSQFYGSFFKEFDHSLFQKMVTTLKLDLNKYFHELSRGQRMQVAFSLTAATRPKLFLIDEITSVLDAHARAYVTGYLGQFTKEGGTVLMATNIVSEVQLYSDHLFLIKNGNLQLNIPKDQFHLLFLKLRKKQDTDHDVFHDPSCFEVGMNSDNSLSYLIPMREVQNYKLPESIFDNRAITTEEIFIYYTKDENGAKNV